MTVALYGEMAIIAYCNAIRDGNTVSRMALKWQLWGSDYKDVLRERREIYAHPINHIWLKEPWSTPIGLSEDSSYLDTFRRIQYTKQGGDRERNGRKTSYGKRLSLVTLGSRPRLHF